MQLDCAPEGPLLTLPRPQKIYSRASRIPEEAGGQNRCGKRLQPGPVQVTTLTELWVRHSGRQVFKDRRLKLPVQGVPAYNDYVERYHVTGRLFPYTPRLLSQLITEAAENAGIRKRATASRLRDAYVIRSVRRGMQLDEIFEKLGLAKNSYEDARKKYGRLTKEAL